MKFKTMYVLMENDGPFTVYKHREAAEAGKKFMEESEERVHRQKMRQHEVHQRRYYSIEDVLYDPREP